MKKKKRKTPKVREPYLIPVGLVDYEVKTKCGAKAPDGEKVLGVCVFDNRLITIEGDISDHAQYLTAWHEYLHALFAEMGYITDCSNESKVECLAQNLARAAPVIVDKYLQKKK